jgi:multidrug transporter EmrE-like cation transporter
MNNYLILTLAIFFNAFANILIKIGMLKIGREGELLKLLFKAILHPAIIFGIFSFVLALGAYGYTLSHINLSIAYPIMTSLGFLIVILVSWIFLKESITIVQLFGFIFILIGVFMVAR